MGSGFHLTSCRIGPTALGTRCRSAEAQRAVRMLTRRVPATRAGAAGSAFSTAPGAFSLNASAIPNNIRMPGHHQPFKTDRQPDHPLSPREWECHVPLNFGLVFMIMFVITILELTTDESVVLTNSLQFAIIFFGLFYF